MIDPTSPYNDLPLIPPIGFNFDDPDLLKKSLQATSTIASLNTAIRTNVNNLFHTMNLMSPLYVPEAVASSGIENIITTNERIYQLQLLEENELSPADKEVDRYLNAVIYGYKLLNKNKFLATNQYLEIQKILEPSKRGLRKLPGTQLSNPNTNEVHYTPPVGEALIRSLLKNFEQYFNDEAPAHEIFCRAAILHYQFEAIHPFYDGNGRTGRMLIPLYLTHQKLLDAPILFVSKYILEHRDEYYTLLRNVTFKGEWKPWVLYILSAIDSQATYTLTFIEKIQYFKDELDKKLEKLIGHTYARDVATLLYQKPYFVQTDFEQELAISPMTARKYLKVLEDAEIVAKRKQHKRNRYLYVCPEYLTLLKKA